MRTAAVFLVLCAAAIAALSGCGQKKRTSSYSTYYNTEAPIEFLDEVQTNVQQTAEGLPLEFVDSKGQPLNLAQYRGKKNVVLVFTRGFNGALCPFCTAQTSRLITNYNQFTNRDAEVLVVYPGERETVADFVVAAEETAGGTRKVPFPMLLDVDFKAVDQLGIRADLAKPSTYILDKQGDLRFAYVGSSLADRPSVKAMLDQLDILNAGDKVEAAPVASGQ